MMMKRSLNVFFIVSALVSPLANASARDDGDPDNNDQYTQNVAGPQPQLIQQEPAYPVASVPPAIAAAPAASPKATKASVKADAMNAKEAADVAKHAAHVAHKVAKHSVKVTHHAKSALKHALGALHDARIESSGLDKGQKASLKKAEAKLREATKAADHGKLQKIKERDLQKEKMEAALKKKASMSEKDHMRKEIQELRETLKSKKVDDKEISQALDELEADLDKSDGPINDESKAELERLRRLVDSLEEPEADPPKGLRKATEPLEIKEKAGEVQTESNEKATPVIDQSLDIDTQMPYGDLEPFGREDTAQELTESSIRESDGMVDQLERAEVAEEKRAVFRALTRLRGAAITSYDGVARSQTGNIDQYNKIHRWRGAHPLHHLADEESDVSKWAFPDNAD